MKKFMTQMLLLLWTAVTFASTSAQSKNVINQSKFISCDQSATINITDGYLDQDGKRFHHDGLIYEPEMFAEFDFVIVNVSLRISVVPHIRGCVCELKKCIRVCRFCTTKDEDISENSESKCVKTETLTLVSDENIETEISLQDNSYIVLTGRTCKTMIFLEPENFDEDKWLFKVG